MLSSIISFLLNLHAPHLLFVQPQLYVFAVLCNFSWAFCFVCNYQASTVQLSKILSELVVVSSALLQQPPYDLLLCVWVSQSYWYVPKLQSSFLWGYLLSPIAGGALADHYGGKSVMGWGVAMWSLATLLTPWAARQSLWALLTMRVLMGLAEGVTMPCMNNMISKLYFLFTSLSSLPVPGRRSGHIKLIQ